MLFLHQAIRSSLVRISGYCYSWTYLRLYAKLPGCWLLKLHIYMYRHESGIFSYKSWKKQNKCMALPKMQTISLTQNKTATKLNQTAMRALS